jgi:uncharacterized membrane protein
MIFGWGTPVRWSGLWAAARVDTGPLYYVGLAVIVAIVVGVLIAAYRTWEEIHDVEEPDSPADLLETFRQAHAQGEIDDHELDRVRRLLASAEEGAVGESAGNGPPQSAVASSQPPGPGEDAGSVPAEGTGQRPT